MSIVKQVRRKREEKKGVLEEQRRSIRDEKAAVALCLKVVQQQPKVNIPWIYQEVPGVTCKHCCFSDYGIWERVG